MPSKQNTISNSSFWQALKLIRFYNLLILFLSQLIVRVFLVSPYLEKDFIYKDLKFLLLCLSTQFIAASGYIINDYYDVKIDIINKPERVVIGKSLKRRKAMFGHFILNLIGVALGFVISWKIGIINILTAFLLWFYSNRLKRIALVGNITISFLTALSIYVVAVFYKEAHEIIFVFALFSFFISLIREIIKDMEDWKGDSTFGCKTLPIIWGIRKTKNLLYFILTIFFVLITFIGIELNPKVFIFLIIFILIPLFYFAFRLYKADTIKDFHFLSQFCKAIMVNGVISMAFVY